jgi:hypothetical protein
LLVWTERASRSGWKEDLCGSGSFSIDNGT